MKFYNFQQHEWTRECYALLNNADGERQLLYVALGSLQPTECQCQFLQLKGTFLKKTNTIFKE